MIDGKRFFLIGIGGSGMMPLAAILRGRGAKVAGSDRGLDAGRVPAKFDYLRKLGITLHPQDGSGVRAGDTIVASAAVEDSVPDMVRAAELGCARMRRAALLADLFNAAPQRIAVGGTSGKSTVTGMIGWMLHAAGHDPSVMNGAVMTNFASAGSPFASALVGSGDTFVSEVDESDGSIALFTPGIAVLNNVSLDHKSMDELRALFGDFLAKADVAVVNIDNAEAAALAPQDAVTVALDHDADLRAVEIEEAPFAVTFTLVAKPPSPFRTYGAPSLSHRERSFGSAMPPAWPEQRGALSTRNWARDTQRRGKGEGDERHQVTLAVPGRHNVANALAALAAVRAAGLPLTDAVRHLTGFTGLRRRFERIGEANGITVIDDFGHNPDKIAATLATLHAFPGRLLILFQPHGYGPLKVMRAELAAMFRDTLAADDLLVMPDPVYQGGTVTREVTSADLTGDIGGRTRHIADRDEAARTLVAEARPGDRIIVMGARDDTLSLLARDVAKMLDGKQT